MRTRSSGSGRRRLRASRRGRGRRSRVIQQAQADVDAKAAQATFAEQDDSRYQRLAQTGYGSRQNAERSLALSNAAQSALIASRAGVDAARQQLAVTNAEIVEARAAVAQAEADIAAPGSIWATRTSAPPSTAMSRTARRKSAPLCPPEPISSPSSQHKVSGWTQISRRTSSSE